MAQFRTFSHFQLGNGHVTAALDVHDDNVDVALSFCSPRDSFDKSNGRARAVERLSSKDKYFTSLKVYRNQSLKGQVWAQLMSKFAYSDENICPLWARRVAPRVISRMFE